MKDVDFSSVDPRRVDPNGFYLVMYQGREVHLLQSGLYRPSLEKKQKMMKRQAPIYARALVRSTRNHPNLIPFLGSDLKDVVKDLHHDLHLIFAVDESANDPLHRKLQNPSLNLPWHLRASLMNDIASAMNHLHSQGR